MTAGRGAGQGIEADETAAEGGLRAGGDVVLRVADGVERRAAQGAAVGVFAGRGIVERHAFAVEDLARGERAVRIGVSVGGERRPVRAVDEIEDAEESQRDKEVRGEGDVEEGELEEEDG